MSISPTQIRAALGLINWSSADLARAMELTPVTISHILTGQSQKAATIDKIRQLLELHGVEFLPRDGVALADDTVKRLEGDDCYLRLLQDVLAVSQTTDSEVLFAFVRHGKSSKQIMDAHEAIVSAGIKVRLLAAADDQNFIYPRHCYRIMPVENFPDRPLVIYGDRFASSLMLPTRQVIIIRNAAAVDSVRALFEGHWSNSPMPKAYSDV